MKVLFFGASELGYDCCESLINSNIEIAGIFTIPQDYSIKYKDEKEKILLKNVTFKDFNELGHKYNIPVITVEGNVGRHQDYIQNLKPDLILVIGWYYMIPKSIMQIPPKGAIGIHASLLPEYRGNAPLVWAIINGEKESGVSLFYFDDGVDTGDIIAQKRFDIAETDTIKDVLEKTKICSKDILIENMPLLKENKAARLVQDHTKATTFPKRTPKDGEIDWSLSAKNIKDFIRAQTKPYPGAFTMIGGKKIIIWDADIE
ncbi:MAG: methionyl-tRNA formyltransferase [Chitinophagaceae bacterium]|nr:methionyl-tRNA formyltransferase [Chitinophagaceae bacterium]